MGACDDPAPYGEAEGEAEGPPDRVHYGGQVRHSVVGEDLGSRCQYLHLHLFVFLQLHHQVLLLLIHFIFCIHEIYKDVVVCSLRAALPGRGCLEGGCRAACSSMSAHRVPDTPGLPGISNGSRCLEPPASNPASCRTPCMKPGKYDFLHTPTLRWHSVRLVRLLLSQGREHLLSVSKWSFSFMSKQL